MTAVIQMDFSTVFRRMDLTGCGADIVRLDLTSLPETNGYCSMEAADAIRRSISSFAASGIHLLDSGNYHYASLFWMEKIRKPYELLVFDHHTDMQAPAWGGALLSCGSWVRDACRNPLLRSIYLAGPDGMPPEAEGKDDSSIYNKVSLLTHADWDAFLERAQTSANPFYISVDKDILLPSEVETNWDGGSWALSELQYCLDTICSRVSVIGVDICGEPEAEAAQMQIGKSERVNREILSLLCKKM